MGHHCIPRLTLFGVLGGLTACMPALDTPEGRRAAYLDCARDQGVPVIDGRIRVRDNADFELLDACEALPR
ncbi:hypothetical protein jaqu_05270 [Jannaschia aquimarina]|uniref:Uncharacterized protein n=1 Tax=Jannaschia aquimarina TaxID=935700 RepID=A0A0D1EKW9_9RHOB|nr:hypothetical protein jaqu_05270 [Jannaschia aquimarina]SNS80292.1 hypothetical protein SAMN05421775_102354 [Jannaschia aquimarina]